MTDHMPDAVAPLQAFVSTLACECVGDGQGGHHPMCEHRPKGVEIRGFIAMNGKRELCFFPTSTAEGVPLGYHFPGLKDTIAAAPARRVSHDELAALDPPLANDPVCPCEMPHGCEGSHPECPWPEAPAHDCDVELRADPAFRPSQCKPETFKCSCGTQYAHVCDEAEGCWWEAMKP